MIDRTYAAALEAALLGRPDAAADSLESILEFNPRDALALKLAHQLRFQIGDKRGLLAGVAQNADAFTGTRFEGFVLGCLAFARGENGDYQGAEAAGLTAVGLAPHDAWGRHAVAHVLEMTGRASAGASWLERSSDRWTHVNNSSYHLWWHLALFLLELGRTDDVLQLYDERIRASRSDDYRDLANGASLLQRLELEGVDIGERWAELANIAAARTQDRRLVFADLHYQLALLAAGQSAQAGAITAALGGDTRPCSLDDEVAHGVGLGLSRAISAFRGGAYAAAAAGLDRAMPQLVRIGGSSHIFALATRTAPSLFSRPASARAAAAIFSRPAVLQR
jgi:tetratricopeptide (TPR) repeat protein